MLLKELYLNYKFYRYTSQLLANILKNKSCNKQKNNSLYNQIINILNK